NGHSVRKLHAPTLPNPSARMARTNQIFSANFVPKLRPRPITIRETVKTPLREGFLRTREQLAGAPCPPSRSAGGCRCPSGGMFGDMQSDLGRGGAAQHVLPAAQRRGGQFRRRGTGTLPRAWSLARQPRAAAMALIRTWF